VADYTNDSQQNLLAILTFLGHSPLEAKTLAEVETFTGLSKDQAFRTLWNLEHAGWVEKSGQGYRLAPRLTEFSERLRRDIAELADRYLGVTNA